MCPGVEVEIIPTLDQRVAPGLEVAKRGSLANPVELVHLAQAQRIEVAETDEIEAPARRGAGSATGIIRMLGHWRYYPRETVETKPPATD